MKKDKTILKSEWKNRPLNFRIEAVIHDGQWYTFDKWKRVALVKDENDTIEFETDSNGMKIINKEEIKSSGAVNVVVTSENSVQVIIGPQVQFVADELKKL